MVHDPVEDFRGFRGEDPLIADDAENQMMLAVCELPQFEIVTFPRHGARPFLEGFGLSKIKNRRHRGMFCPGNAAVPEDWVFGRR
jgi:hypothetical protein